MDKRRVDWQLCFNHTERKELGHDMDLPKAADLTTLKQGLVAQRQVVVEKIPIFAVSIPYVRPHTNKQCVGTKNPVNFCETMQEIVFTWKVFKEIAGERDID